MENEQHWEKWWASLNPPGQQAVIIRAEMRAAAKEPLDEAVAFKASKLSESQWERVKGYEVWEQLGFEEWLAGKATLVDAVSGHIRLAVACSELWRENDYARQWGVLHAGASGDSGVKDMIWERQGRRWEWMAGHPGGFIVAGRDLVALGHDKVGRVLLQYGHLGEPKKVAFKLVLYGGSEMEGEVRDVIGIEPYGGGMLDEALEVKFWGHEGTVLCVSDAGGGKIVTGGVDMTVKVWDVYSGKCLMTLQGHTLGVWAVVVVGGRVISGGDDETLRVWDRESGECKQVVENAAGGLGLCVVDESTIVSCGEAGAVLVWKIGDDGQLKKEKELKGHSDDVHCVIALGGGRVASGGQELEILVHDVKSGDVIGKLEGHTSLINDLAVLADGRLVSSSCDGTLRVWSSNCTGEAEMVIDGYESDSSCVVVLENGMIVSGAGSGGFQVWSVEGASCKALGEIQALRGGVRGLQALDGGRVACISADEHIFVWDVSRFDGEKRQVGHKSVVTCGAVLSDSRIVTYGYGGLVVWEKAERGKRSEMEKALRVGAWGVLDIAATFEGLAWCDSFGTFLWKGGTIEREKLDFDCINLCSLSSGLLLLGINHQRVFVYGFEEKRVLRTVVLDGRLLCLEPLDSKRVAVGGEAGRVFVVSVANGSIEKEQLIGSSDLRSIICVGDGKLIVSNQHNELWFWDEKGAPEKLPDGLSKAFTSLDDDKVIIKTTHDEMIVWNWKTQEREVEFGGLNVPDVVDVAWDASRRLAVFFMKTESCWIAYEL